MVTAKQIINSIKPRINKVPTSATQKGSAGYDNPRDDIEKVKKVREIDCSVKGTFADLDVDTLNLNGNVISDSTGTISFDDDDITTTGNIRMTSDSNVISVGSGAELSFQNDAGTGVISANAGNMRIQSSGGTISFDDENLTTTGTITGINVTSGNDPGHTHTAVTEIKTGMIIIWSGTIATIPTGFVLCNGANGTPDLRDRFVLGANQDISGTPRGCICGNQVCSGGICCHCHTEPSGHCHCMGYSGCVCAGSGCCCAWNYCCCSCCCCIITDCRYHYPPTYALAYIMKT